MYTTISSSLALTKSSQRHMKLLEKIDFPSCSSYFVLGIKVGRGKPVAKLNCLGKHYVIIDQIPIVEQAVRRHVREAHKDNENSCGKRTSTIATLNHFELRHRHVPNRHLFQEKINEVIST
ncbi:unnamed protein product [Trichobilharzia szidati]|nr:unnamed protein product [Trichobilharzia szidati]